MLLGDAGLETKVETDVRQQAGLECWIHGERAGYIDSFGWR
jgi:hypothetical protein